MDINIMSPAPEIIFPDFLIFKNYEHLRKYTSTQLYNLINEISKKKFHLSNYGIRCFDKKNIDDKKLSYGNHLISNKDSGENIFDVEVISNNNEKIIKNRIYKFTFNSLIGRAFYQNMILLNNNLIDLDYENGSFYKMRGLSQFFYRRFLACKKNNKKQIFTIQEIDIYFACNKINISLFKKSISGILKKLKENNYIKDESISGISYYTLVELTKIH
jgi:hypothetical protein